MNKVRFSIKSFQPSQPLRRSRLGVKSILVVLASALPLTTAIVSETQAAQSQPDRTQAQVLLQVAQDWIAVGTKQYQRCFYGQAERSLLIAHDYCRYLTVAERDKLSELLEKTRIALLERRLILEHIKTANELIEQNQLIEAVVRLEKVKDSQLLTTEEQKQIAEILKKLGNQLNEQRREIGPIDDCRLPIDELKSKIENRKSEILSAAPMEKTPIDDFRLTIDELKSKIENRKSGILSAEPLEKAPEAAVVVTEDKLVGAGVGEITQNSKLKTKNYGTQVKEPAARRGNILRSYTGAVVKDALVKVQNYISQGEFDKAKEVVEATELIVSQNRLHIGDELFRHYSVTLKKLADKIVREEKERDD